MLPVEITSLQTSMTTSGPGVREPVSGQPMPINLIDLVIVPGMGFTNERSSHRARHGVLRSFPGTARFSSAFPAEWASKNRSFPTFPCLTTTCSLSMLCTDRGIRRFATNCISP